jgi:hypothetical protein
LLTPRRGQLGIPKCTTSADASVARASAMNAGVSRRLDGCNVLPYTELGGVRSREREAKVAGTSL